ncbi:hypothetical protein HS088_TW22G00123 [Tripterygium wilfordii]|uniref:Late embryogenesis abundant protein LEA-2 subgroup domain-containing protein n=1 Tax=Tripterygium wilfordii TaxID=458696 RepID=A0A7J7BXM0_TRIWF|nr:late embryogenesis abundant protein At1g64065-like [Tripterygium wilfordii]KAF5726445.1 hypothetical protein HS088_TW22G00123 [Tripterygium wilfordii]
MTRTSQRGLKICGALTAIVVVILIIVITTLSLTIFKLKRPEITAHSAGIQNFQFNLFPPSLNATLDVVFTINNPNYGSFEFTNSTGNVYYHGVIVADVPVQEGFVPARGTFNTTSLVDIMGDEVISNPNFSNDLEAGSFNLTSEVVLPGRMKMLKVLNLHAKAYITCNISVFLHPINTLYKCESNIKL